MDFKNILKTDYLDIIFQGKNKKYGGYELRKKYNGRMLLAALIGIGTMSLIFAMTLVDFNKVVVDEELNDVDKTIAMVNVEPPPLKPNEPPPPAPTAPPPPAKPTVKFTPPIIKPNKEVKKEEKMVEQDKEEERTSSSATKEGSNEKGATDFGDLGGKTGGTEQKKEEKAVEKKEDPNEIKKQIEVKASFKGNFNSFLNSNLNYPAAASAEGISGRVQVQFVVNVDGSVSDVRVLGKGLGGGLNNEAIRVIKKSSGMWEAGKEKNKKYRSVFVQPITFTLQ